MQGEIPLAQELLRSLPAVHEVLKSPLLAEAVSRDRMKAKDCVRQVLERWRERILKENLKPPQVEILAAEAAELFSCLERPSLRRVINATGVVLHTNLGRALLSLPALEAIQECASHYTNLELDLNTGERGSRYTHVVDLLREITGAEAALVVNNNAAAVFLCLAALAAGKETIVSRGELVEIGGSFRVPEVMMQSGTRLVEVGTTNKTYLADYERAISPETALILKVHPSNYRILGFTHQVSTRELVSLGRKYNIPVMEDLGSGSFVDLSLYGLHGEPTVQEEVAAGVDLLTFSGDKLLGGPQAGIIVGREALIRVIAKHPLNRALRIDKLTLAALEATLRAYRDPQRAREEIPTLRLLTLPQEELERRAQKLYRLLKRSELPGVEIKLVQVVSQAGGGSLPLAELPSWGIAIRPLGLNAVELAARLRQGEPPVLTRIQDEAILLDLRTVLPGEEVDIVRALARALA
ncbi:L-seryl-tRNA(Sec) selenium transferase [Thermanaeromonas toyohensis ToBE]|uniref:L-seryl-tRNA(Sec) selenium transferase n=1 Tax=Thermanaeromonas toyohensis ToBE TaxID=698762 RepID=A0A1W1W3X5_9FIRM|nr:L-seryl-tRNA(Sec) selenium transferase [Thermanaeromonas toyohensis]SMC00160.1 L-seryl-tRNA(Sec) selenium transferase [Thermanaeromonas toyohensis ToBE]